MSSDGERIDLTHWLSCLVSSTAEREVVAGADAQVPMRLRVERVPEEVRQERVERLRREAHKHGRCVSEQSEQLACWTLLLTTAGRELLSLSQALVVVRVRWQIELLFK